MPVSTISLLEFDMPLIGAFASLIEDYQNGRRVSPHFLFNQVRRKAPRFYGGNQQDAHELLRHLLDGLRQEEIDRFTNAFVNSIDKKSDEEKQLNTEQARLCKAYLEVN